LYYQKKNNYYEQIKKISKLKQDSIRVIIDDPIVNVLNASLKNNYIACGAGINNLGLSSDGTVYPCIFLREEIGN